MYALLGAALKIIAHSSFVVSRLCCLGLPFFKIRRSLSKTKKVQRYNFNLFWVPPCLPCPSFALLKLFLWWKKYKILAQRAGGSSSLCGFCWFTLLNHWAWCCSSGCGSDAVSVAAFPSVSLQRAFLGQAHPGWHGLLRAWETAALPSSLAPEGHSHHPPPTSSHQLACEIAGKLPNTSKRARQWGVKLPTLCCLYVAWGHLL